MGWISRNHKSPLTVGFEQNRMIKSVRLPLIFLVRSGDPFLVDVSCGPPFFMFLCPAIFSSAAFTEAYPAILSITHFVHFLAMAEIFNISAKDFVKEQVRLAALKTEFFLALI